MHEVHFRSGPLTVNDVFRGRMDVPSDQVDCFVIECRLRPIVIFGTSVPVAGPSVVSDGEAGGSSVNEIPNPVVPITPDALTFKPDTSGACVVEIPYELEIAKGDWVILSLQAEWAGAKVAQLCDASQVYVAAEWSVSARG